jgi:hypothetical protein
MATVAACRPEIAGLDAERYRWVLRRRLPGVPYRAYRPLVQAFAPRVRRGALGRGPAPSGKPLIVHDPATRPQLRALAGSAASSKEAALQPVVGAGAYGARRDE